MIEKLIAQSRVSEVANVAGRIVTKYQSTDLNTDAHLAGIMGEIIPANQQLVEAVRQDKADSVLALEDENRDGKTRPIFYFVQGCLYHPEPAIKQAAEQINKVLENFGLEIIRENYTVESTLIDSLLNDLSKPELQPAIAALPGFAQMIAALADAQASFESARIAYESEQAEEGTLANASEIKKTVVTLVNEKLVVYLRAMLQVDETTYGPFARTVAQMIADNNEIVKRRRKKPEAPIE
jgi:hypothetical protein